MQTLLAGRVLKARTGGGARLPPAPEGPHPAECRSGGNIVERGPPARICEKRGLSFCFLLACRQSARLLRPPKARQASVQKLFLTPWFFVFVFS